jgi:Protein of unknown function (DUF3006).
MDEFFVVDRVENNIAVLECPDGKFLNVEVDSLPFKVREGNVLLKNRTVHLRCQMTKRKKEKPKPILFRKKFSVIGEKDLHLHLNNGIMLPQFARMVIIAKLHFYVLR